jgi:hypothetical protein
MNIKTQNKQHIIQSKSAGLVTQFVVPFAGVHRATSLTISDGNNTIGLNGRQIRALQGVLSKSNEITRLKNVNNTKKPAKPAKPAKPVKPVKTNKSGTVN